MDLERSLQDVIGTLREAKRRGSPAVVLLGAGCSASAEIPLARGFVEEVRDGHFAEAYRRAARRTEPDEPGYPYVMAELDVGPRYELIARHVDRAKLNWAHVLLGWLLKNGYVGRVMTTNFDNLVARACSLFGIHPSTYDLALASDRFDASLIRDPSVFFLHGQHSGMLQLHAADEVEENAKTLKPAFDDAAAHRPWIVVGYSGENDPVFENLVAIRRFTNALYWVGYKKEDPPSHVSERLLSRERQAYLVRGYTADRFFLELMRGLGLEAPPFVSDPFEHMLEILDRFAPFPGEDEGGTPELTLEARRLLVSAQSKLVSNHVAASAPNSTELLRVHAGRLFLEGRYEEVLKAVSEEPPPLGSLLTEVVSTSHYELGMQKLQLAESLVGDAQEPAYLEASDHFRTALEFAPAKHSAWFSLAFVLSELALLHKGAEADRLFDEAHEGFRRSVEGDYHAYESYLNWGIALIDQSRMKEGDQATKLLAQAREITLMALALRQQEDADSLFNLACIAGLLGHPREANEWLNKRREVLPLLTQEKVKAERDFDRISEDPQFQEFVESLPTG